MVPAQCTFSGLSVLGKSPLVQAASLLVCCWVEAPSLLYGYRVPWALEPPSWMGGCPNN